MDFFPQAPKYVTAGVFIDRPPRGSIYFGFHSLEGPISSNVLLTTYSYRMSPKWISTFGMSYDFVAKRNIGQNLTLTRIGESFLMTFNMNVDTSKNNIGANVMVDAALPARAAWRTQSGHARPGGAGGRRLRPGVT